MEKLEIPTRKRNRYTAQLPKSGLFWCGKCDRNQVAVGGKCSKCGEVNGTQRKHRNEISLK